MRKILIPTIALVAIIVSYNLMQENPIKQNEPSAKTNTNKIEIKPTSNQVVSQPTESVRFNAPQKTTLIKTPKGKTVRFHTPTSPAEDSELSETEKQHLETYDKALNEGYGKTPPTSEKNPQVSSVIEALSNNQFPERKSPIIRPKPFNKDAFTNDENYRESYLNTAEFGRVFQSLDPAEDTPKISRLSSYYQEVEQGDSIYLEVEAAPNMPVTFTSFDLGKFANGLTTQTIQADSSGYASVEFHGMPGTIADTNVLASSPASSGQIKFLINTTLQMEENNE